MIRKSCRRPYFSGSAITFPARLPCFVAGIVPLFKDADHTQKNMSLTRPASSKTKGYISLEDLRSFEIDRLFVSTMNEVGDKTGELISHYRESRKAEEDMIYEIQKDLLNSWPDDGEGLTI